MRLNKIFSMAVAAAALLSCAKEINPDQGGVNNTNKEVMTIEAQVEQQVETKTSLSGNVVSWTDGDKLSVFSGLENVLFELKGINNGVGSFEGDAPAADVYYALYPYSAAATISAEGVISTVLPSNQYGVAGTFDNNLNISVAKFEGSSMTMRNVCGLVKFNITRSDITSVTLFGNGHEYLAGAIDITIAENGTPSYTVKNGVKYVMLTPKTGETFAPGTYYFTVLPQTLKGGMSLVYNVDDQSGTVATGSDAAVNRSEYLNITANPENALALNNIIDLSNPDGDATSETANCYVAGLAGRRYCFPATVMGNGVTTPADNSYTTTTTVAGSSPELAPTPINPEKAMLLWQTAQSLVKHVVLKDGKIYFTLNGNVGGTLTEGNALLAGIGADNLPSWSWHIWVTDDDLDAKVQTWTVHSSLADYSAYKNPQLMDRNLGALTNELWVDSGNNQANGLFYQFGRKDPFPGADDTAKGSTTRLTTYDENDVALADIAKITVLPTDFKWYHQGTTLNKENIGKYPMLWSRIGNGTCREDTYHNLWGRPPYTVESNKKGTKTIYDPCPPGYKVMDPYGFSGLSETWEGGAISSIEHKVINTSTARTDGGLKVYCSEGVEAIIPFTGTISNDGPVLHRTEHYGHYWTSTTSSIENYNGMVNLFDYNNLLLHRNKYQFSTASGGVSRYFSRACRGNVVRCEVNKVNQ